MSYELPSSLINVGELLQHVSRVVYRNSPLYYGRNSTNRYDDPARAYGVLYLGRDLPTALMESVFHKHQWLADTKRSIALKEVQGRMVRAVGVMADLHLADLTASGVMAGYFGLNLEQLVSRDYTHTQQVSAQLHAMAGDDHEHATHRHRRTHRPCLWQRMVHLCAWRSARTELVGVQGRASGWHQPIAMATDSEPRFSTLPLMSSKWARVMS
ncbi:RES family NAD+ phosphorylase [Castellaniella caeni]|uniref:RES family NAD+ phosphorylase n=1 Tax=Castellaniella caeni TaxID=266123 RepID=UPI000A5E5E07